MKLEELLNKLIERGWKPRGHINYKICKYNDMLEKVSFNNKDYIGLGEHSLRELVSKESGLWQFVCENGIINYNRLHRWTYHKKLIHSYRGEECEYRLIESSLKDESELEDFLLQNIKVDE